MCKLSLLIRVLVLILFTFLFEIAPFSSIQAASTPTLYVDPPSTIVDIDEIFSVNVSIASVTDLGGWEFRLYYRNNILNGVTAKEGPFLKQGGSTSFFTIDFNNAYNTTHGIIWLTCVLQGGAPGVGGSGTLATINFTAVENGDTILHLADTVLGDSLANPITHTTTDGTVRVGTLLGDINGDGIVDIFDALILAGAFGSQPSDPNWYAGADINSDDVVDIFDALILAGNFGKTL